MLPQATQAVTEADLERRFGGLARLYGRKGAARIRAAHVVVVGIGGVGSWAAEALARSGVGRLTLVDLDHVSESNINRQIHATGNTVGQAKVQAMHDRILDIHPAMVVDAIEDFVDPDNAAAILPAHADAVIDCCDQVKAKVAIAALALQRRQALVCVGAAGGKKLAHAVELDDLSKVTHDPLLAQVRNRLRREHGAPRDGKRMGVACVFSREAVQGPVADSSDGAQEACDVDNDGSLNCHGYGSVVAVTATFGQCAAGWVLQGLAASANV